MTPNVDDPHSQSRVSSLVLDHPPSRSKDATAWQLLRHSPAARSLVSFPSRLFLGLALFYLLLTVLSIGVSHHLTFGVFDLAAWGSSHPRLARIALVGSFCVLVFLTLRSLSGIFVA